jgi:O-antigen/teichoic acid export membrane protein
MQEKSFHRIIFKNTGLFGFSQVVKILVRLVSNKVAAIFLGPFGIGIISFLENILNLIQGFTNMGIASSSVREIALITDEKLENNIKEQRLLKIIYKWAWFTGILGVIVCLIFSKYISNVVFDTDSYYKWIMVLSIYFFFTSISSIRLAVLQAKKKVLTIVKFHVVNAIFSSFLAVSFYYFFGVEGIIPVFLFGALFTFILSLYFTRKIKILQVSLSLKEIFKEGLPMVKLGLLLSVSVVFGQICFYIIRWYLKSNYSLETLGIYQVSNTILVGYLGLVFSAMSNDFYPRLCNYDQDKEKFNELVNDQTELALFLVVPAVLLLYIIAPFLVELLYSTAFLDVLQILQIGLIAIVLKAISWPIGFIPLVKGNKMLYLKQNVFGESINLIASIVLFKYFGLLGLGIAMVAMFLTSGFYNYYVAVNKYNFAFRNDTLRVLIFSLVISLFAVLSVLNYGFTIMNPILVVLFLVSALYSLGHLKNKLKSN